MTHCEKYNIFESNLKHKRDFYNQFRTILINYKAISSFNINIPLIQHFLINIQDDNNKYNDEITKNINNGCINFITFVIDILNSKIETIYDGVINDDNIEIYNNVEIPFAISDLDNMSLIPDTIHTFIGSDINYKFDKIKELEKYFMEIPIKPLINAKCGNLYEIMDCVKTMKKYGEKYYNILNTYYNTFKIYNNIKGLLLDTITMLINKENNNWIELSNTFVDLLQKNDSIKKFIEDVNVFKHESIFDSIGDYYDNMHAKNVIDDVINNFKDCKYVYLSIAHNCNTDVFLPEFVKTMKNGDKIGLYVIDCKEDINLSKIQVIKNSLKEYYNGGIYFSTNPSPTTKYYFDIFNIILCELPNVKFFVYPGQNTIYCDDLTTKLKEYAKRLLFLANDKNFNDLSTYENISFFIEGNKETFENKYIKYKSKYAHLKNLMNVSN